jgi:all-trans-retinol 13,14-reductase
VPSNITLQALAELLLEVMGWMMEHLYQFRFKSEYYCSKEQIKDSLFPSDDKDFAKVALSDLLTEKGVRMKLEYDYGDSWEHDVWVKGIREYDKGEKPSITFVNGHGECPPEDCGGVWGYADLLGLTRKKKLTAEERENLEKYVDDIFGISDHVDLFNLRPSQGQMSFFTQSDDFMLAADDFIARHTNNKKLRSVLAYMNPLYGGRAHETPAYIHAIISTLYIEGESRFVDGSGHFAQLLADLITGLGGQVLPNKKIEWIEINDRKVDYVIDKDGQKHTADYYISDIHPCTLLQLTDEKAFPKSYRERLNSIPNTHSAFSLYIKLKPKSFPYLNYSEYYMTRYDDVWNFSRTDRPWPLGFLLMTPPTSEQSEYASKVLITSPMSFEMVKKWEDTTTGHRGEDYEIWKRERARELLSQIEDMHPGFSGCIEHINTSSPLTIRDFYAVKDGSICGFSKNCQNMTLSQLPVVTKVKNLLLTGQNNNLHGFCGVPLTAINTCEAILGQNYVINKINACKE